VIGLRPARRSTALLLGGARSGKSRAAEEMFRRVNRVIYVACGALADGSDPEWADRVAAHQSRRPAGWDTLETRDLTSVIQTSGPPALIDCLGTWLAGVMDDIGVWSGEADSDALLAAQVDALVAAWARPARRVVAVSNEVGSGIIPATASGRRFRDELGSVNARLAATSDAVWLVTAGIKQRLR
jgi:adenosylcobinamide kinase/adenosylcobinamide-phosphate guanylyltransferase